jgi:hypothetical protein
MTRLHPVMAQALAPFAPKTDLRFRELAELIDPERPATATCCMCTDEADPADRLGRCPQDAFEGDVEHLGAMLSESWTPAPGLEGWRRDCLATVERLLPRIRARLARKEG